MSIILNGDPSHITTPLVRTVSSIASGTAGVWRVQTSVPHLFGDKDYVSLSVTISAVLTVEAGLITVIDSTHFDVAGTTYTATGTGTATDLSLTPQFLAPTDGDSFSLQISGMLSALQALADRTQALRYMMVARESRLVQVTSTQDVPVPAWATAVVVDGCGGGGGAGGGPGGFASVANNQLAAGGGGAGAKRASVLRLISGQTSISVTIGAGGAGGAGSAGSATPTPASPGSNGGSTTAVSNPASLTLAAFPGGNGGPGGGGSAGVAATPSSSPIFTPGGAAGPPTRAGAAGLYTQTAPGPSQLINIVNAAGVVSASGAWPTSVYTDPVGPRQFNEGGASMATCGNATYSAGISYAGAEADDGTAGGTGASSGTASTTNYGGAGGGGGGAGGFGLGGNAGAGGNGGNVTGANGTAGTAAGANTGGGGGGGGGGGSGGTTGGNGAAGGNGGSGLVNLIFLGFPATP